MSYTPPTIAERGGLKVYLPTLGIDYDQFKKLKESFTTPGGPKRGAYTSIATILGSGRKEPLSSRTVAHWWKVDDTERSGE